MAGFHVVNDISIVITTYNCERYVEMCIESVFDQNPKYNIELVIVDDGSQDSTIDVLENIVQSVPSNVTAVLHSQPNSGAASARNTGIDFATSNRIAFIDGDDQISRDFCDKLLSTSINTDADLVIGGRVTTASDEDLRGFENDSTFYNFSSGIEDARPFDQDLLSDIFWVDHIGNSAINKVYKTDRLPRFSATDFYEDYPFVCNYLFNCRSIVTVPDITYCYRKGTGTSLMDKRYEKCGWAAQIVESYMLQKVMENLSGIPMKPENLLKSDKMFMRKAKNAVDAGLGLEKILSEQRVKEALSRLSDIGEAPAWATRS